MTYDQVVLLSIPVLLGLGAVATVYVGRWLYPLTYTEDASQQDDGQQAFEFSPFPLRNDPPKFGELARRVKRLGSNEMSISAPGYVMALRSDDDDNVVREKLPAAQ